MPLQVGADVPSPAPVHMAEPQTCVVGAFSQTPPAAQTPVLPQTFIASTVHLPGSLVPACRFVQVPRAVSRLQARHAPAQALLQQTPSTQKSPARQSDIALQFWPRSFTPQTPLKQRLLPEHSGATTPVVLPGGGGVVGTHDSKHAVPAVLQTYAPQATVLPTVHLPSALHVAALVIMPIAHEEVPQRVPGAYLRH